MATNGRGPSSPVNLVAGDTLTSSRVSIVGGLVFVAAADASSGDNVAVYTEGRFNVPKQTGFALAIGDPVYFDDSDNRAENNASLPCIGVCVGAAGSSDTSVDVLLVQTTQPSAGLRKANLAAGARPTTGDDADSGYAVGSEWQFQGIRWVCTDATVGAAKWRPLNPVIAEVTVASGQTAIATAITGLPGVANGDVAIASVKTKGANAAYIVSAAVAGGNLTVTVNTDPGAGGAVCNVAIWPAAVG